MKKGNPKALLPILVFLVVLGMMVISFYYAMNMTNMYVVLKDGMARRAQVVMMQEDVSELTKFFREIFVNAETYSIYARSLSDVLIWAGDLGSGELSQVYRQENRLCLIQCRSRIDQRYAPLEDVASVVLQSIRESRYDELIARRREEATIRGDLDRLYRFTAEQLH